METCKLCGTRGEHECRVAIVLEIFGGKITRIEEDKGWITPKD